MKSGKARIRTTRWVAVACSMGAIASLLLTVSALAGDRQFLVILANSSKEFPGGQPPGGLTNKQLIHNQYFDTTNPSIQSFAEYWAEISYGNVTISGETHDWINLPWPIRPTTSPADFTDLNQSEYYEYGAGELLNPFRAMVIVDITGDPRDSDDGPFSSFGNPPYARGGQDLTSLGLPIWMPGERFIDMDGDGRWDGLDEATNSMDWNGNGRPDLLGPWVDLNRNDVPDNPQDCLYLWDEDNDGFPNCCPDGPGMLKCEPFPAENACPPTNWEGPEGEIEDCNGNLIPDACDVSCISRECEDTGWLDENPGLCGGSGDRLPLSAGDRACDMEAPDDIPDECQFQNYLIDCVEQAVSDPEDPCSGFSECGDIGDFRTATLPRCEFFDSNSDGTLDIVEPFENFLRHWSLPGGWVIVDEQYIRDNYPGDASKVVKRGEVRTLWVERPGENECRTRVPCGSNADCAGVLGTNPTCNTSTHTCVTQIQNARAPNGSIIFNACPVGEHAQYDPPDWWEDIGSTKMQHQNKLHFSPEFLEELTVEPPWYKQAWVDRYGTEPPPWDWPFTPVMIPSKDAERRCFVANHGGLNGNGTGWLGCSDLDANIIFATGDPCDVDESAILFSQACNSPILPEEMNGIGSVLVVYDGPVEHDDLPSSKYHRHGDQRLGEVTSPFNDDIWGHDRGLHRPDVPMMPDGVIPPAGPYATSIHGNFGRDGGNLLHMELLTIRTEPPFNTGDSWEYDRWLTGRFPFHPFAGSLLAFPDLLGENFGFRDYNLDGLVDQGEVRPVGSENYLVDSDTFTPNNGTNSLYPFNRRRLLEDCIEVVDDAFDLDDFVDTVALERVTCGGRSVSWPVPSRLLGGEPEGSTVFASGLLSGIVLLPPGAHDSGDFPFAPSFYPIHNEDGLGDPQYLDANLPRSPRDPALEPNFSPQISWNIFAHDLVIALDTNSQSETIPIGGSQTAYSAHEYLHTWEGFPDLYDYDVFEPPGPVINCPVGAWDIMANGGLVHPVPILKEKPCTEWVTPVDLKTVLTPGVDTVLTLPQAEFIRDDSYYFLENDNRYGERYYFWSAGSGFDARMPGEGLLILHTDVGSNPDALPPQQRSGTRPTYLIVQGDGFGELQAGTDCGDDGDPWPGSADATRFNLDTLPPATWYTQNSWTGIDVLDVLPDGSGSVQLKINWVPTSIPSLRFIDPPGGESVGSTYQVRFEATDVYGGTTIRMYYMNDEKVCSDSGASCEDDYDCLDEFCAHKPTILPGGDNLIGQMRKTTPGTNQLSMDWNISGVPDGRYVLFAKLIPGQGSDGIERDATDPRPGRNNLGNGSLVVDNVNITGNSARSETWTAICLDADGQRWRVNSSLTQPVLNEDDPDADPYDRAFTGQPYTSRKSAVRFTINESTKPFVLEDTLTFTTTGITAVSRSVAIINGQIKEDPTAVISASPLACPAPSEDLGPCPPLTVTFDGRRSYDPNGEPLEYRWDFGDGSEPVSGSQVQNTFDEAGTFTVVLRVTNPNNGRSDEAAVDIKVTNNSPQAVISASPTNGPTPEECDPACSLEVQFSGAQSSDSETSSNRLVYHWDFGDGATANNALTPGTAFQMVEHLYRNRADGTEDGTECTVADPCTFIATLTVIDEGGKEDTDTATIRVGNTNPVPHITHTALEGPDPWSVVFNAIGSSDPDGDELCVKWEWGDEGVDVFPVTGQEGATDGSVAHEYKLLAGDTFGSFSTKATVYDDRCLGDDGCDLLKQKLLEDPDWDDPRCGKAVRLFTVTVSEATVGASDPRAIFTIDPPQPLLDEEFTVDASMSYDLPPGHVIVSYGWRWGDGTATGLGRTATHTYTAPGTYTITLTVEDDEDPPNTGSTSRIVVISGDGEIEPPEPDNQPPIALFTVNPPSGFAGVTLFTFNASASSDPDGDDTKLSYRWSFGDGDPYETGAVVTHVFDQPNLSGYVVRLTVRDEGNASTVFTREVIVKESVGNQSPHAYIATGPRTGTAPVTLTFDGRNSFDPDGDLLQFRWEFSSGGVLIDTLIGPQVTRLFSESGTYTVELEVSDGRGLSDRADPQTIVITAPTELPPPPPGPTEPEPGQEIPNSADQRPLTQMCGFGMIGSLFASLLGLTAIRATRRWRRL